MPSDPRVSIVGAGNWLLSYDRVGPRVLEQIDGRYGEDVATCDIGCAGLALIDHLHGQQLLIIVDACIYGGAPGEVIATTPDLERPPSRETSVHQIGPIEALVVVKHLYPERLPQRVLLLLVETEGMDDTTEAVACERVIAHLDRELDAWRRQREHGAESSTEVPNEPLSSSTTAEQPERQGP